MRYTDVTLDIALRGLTLVIYPVSVLCAFVSFLILLIKVLFTICIGGRRKVRWMPLSSCNGFHAWLTEEWFDYTENGIQSGTRKFGLELAYSGSLPAKPSSGVRNGSTSGTTRLE